MISGCWPISSTRQRAKLNAKENRPANDVIMRNATKRDTSIGPSYLRQQAQRCVRLARDCPHLPTSYELEALGVELMEKAAELDELLDVLATNTTAKRDQK